LGVWSIHPWLWTQPTDRCAYATIDLQTPTLFTTADAAAVRVFIVVVWAAHLQKMVSLLLFNVESSRVKIEKKKGASVEPEDVLVGLTCEFAL
jgi:hypothetical protein